MIDGTFSVGASTRSRGWPMGDVSTALLQAARVEPGTVRELAARAQVGFNAAGRPRGGGV